MNATADIPRWWVSTLEPLSVVAKFRDARSDRARCMTREDAEVQAAVLTALGYRDIRIEERDA